MYPWFLGTPSISNLAFTQTVGWKDRFTLPETETELAKGTAISRGDLLQGP